MASTIGPQQKITRFLLISGNKWNIKDAYITSRLTSFTHSHSYSLHHLPSLRSTFPLSHPSLLSLLRPCSPSLCSMTSSQAADSNPPQSTSTKTVRVVIKGRVQGVFYRNWTIENATQLGLKGWVRNRRDGSVEALFSGTPDSVQEMEQRCRRGPPAAVVTGLEVFPCGDDPEYTGIGRGRGVRRSPRPATDRGGFGDQANYKRASAYLLGY